MAIATQPAPATQTAHSMTVRGLKPFYGKRLAVQALDLDVRPNQILALIGPSGCGKSTVLRCLNRMHELIPYARAEGVVKLDDIDIYAPGVDPALVRRKIGMVFQMPIALRTRNIYENVAVGLRLGGINNKSELDDRVERALVLANLWDEVKDKLHLSGMALSGGQQQRLSIARTIAVEPDVILFDEPCSALDPISTLKIEELLLSLRLRFTIVIVTHNMQQAARISDRTAVFMVEKTDDVPIGVLIEEGPTEQIFSTPKDPRTEDYISGRVG
ncbi:MAG: phosphate ABC transporter ATP-binding protein [Oscillochloridaceae bacterium]|nr:phosphate ABC transporter ATP-binding protein [Chloroflexaceae bacterium]MDW8390934.1 phosphate ABC transporter ATP-binding protein [Oscillochloridaceae bacterium]